MTLEEFKTIYTENPSSDEVMSEIARLYQSETDLTASFAQADSDRVRLQKELDEANKRYRERFFSGPKNDQTENKQNSDPFAQFFKERDEGK